MTKQAWVVFGVAFSFSVAVVYLFCHIYEKEAYQAVRYEALYTPGPKARRWGW